MLKRCVSFMLTLVLLFSFAAPTLAEELENDVSFDDYVMSHAEEFEDTSSAPKIARFLAKGRSVSDPVELDNANAPRYSVLVLDTSGSMRGTPIKKMRQAAIKFCEQILQADQTDNYIGIVSFTEVATIECSFTDNISVLKSRINKLIPTGGTNHYGALSRSQILFPSDLPANAIKNIVLLSDGLPENGAFSDSGPYTSNDYRYYYYANSAYNLAKQMHEDYKIYTLGFYHSLWPNYLSFARRYMSDLSNAGYYEVDDPDDLEFVLGDIATDIVAGEFSFRYASSINEKADAVAKCYYSDDYFKDTSFNYNPHLATASLCFAVSTFTRIEGWDSQDPDDRAIHWPDRMNNAKDLLTGGGVTKGTGLGFRDFDYNDVWNGDPKTDTIGMVMASKPLGNHTLIALALRGGGYYNEWGGNFEIGASGDHENWTKAKANVISELQKYIAEHEIKGDLKLWIVGYSRSGAIANLTAAELNRDGTKLFPGCSLKQEDIYAYTFATPQGTVTAKVTAQGSNKNINNIINHNDIVPRVAMSGYNFRRYGVDRIIYNPADYGSSNTVLAMKKQLKKLFQGAGKAGTNEEVNAFYDIIPDYTRTITLDDVAKVASVLPGGKSLLNFTVNDNRNISNGEMQAIFLQTVVETIGERSVYKKDLQGAISQITGQFLGVHTESKDTIVTNLVTALSKADLDFVKYLDIFDPDVSKAKKTAARATLTSEVWSAISKPLTNGGINISNHSFTTFLNVLLDAYEDDPTTMFALVDNLLGVLNDQPEILYMLNHANIDTGILWFKANELVNMADFGDRFNANLGAAHFADIYLAFLMAEDDYYTNTPAWSDGVPSIRIIRINCPVDVVITDHEGNVVATVKDHKEVFSLPNIGCTVTMDGEIQIRVSGNETFDVFIEATDDGTVCYSVSEFNYDVGKEVRLVNYCDVDVKKGDVLRGRIERIAKQEYAQVSEGSTSSYTLNGPAGNALVPVEISGSQNIRYHNVSVSSMEPSYGTTFGGGEYIEGSFAMVRAFPVDGGKFLGWYENGNLVSMETEYRFSVRRDHKIEGRFEEVPLYNVQFRTAGEGKIENVDLKLSAGTKLILDAHDENNTFVEWTATSGNIEAPKSSSTTITVPACDIIVTAFFDNTNSLAIVQQPVDQHVFVGQKATFSIESTGDHVTYQWYINRNDGNGWRKIKDAFGATHITSATDLDCNGFKYYCKVTDQSGNTIDSNEAVLHVTTAPVLPETGDSSKPELWLVISMVSLLGILLIRKKAYLQCDKVQ